MEKRTHEDVVLVPSGGVDVSKSGDLLDQGVATRSFGFEYDEESAQRTGGARKVLARGARKPGVQTRATMQPMYSALGSVPARGYVFLGYHEELDLGGDFASDGVTGTGAAYHIRRQSRDAWTINLRFRLPEEAALFDIDQRAAAAPARGTEPAGLDNGWEFDEALDHTIVLWQRGGDRTAPMSAFVGLVNVGNAWPSSAPRRSNYALCFGWLDAPQWGANMPGAMRYAVGVGEQLKVGTTGEFSTMAMRVVVWDLFVEPGEDYAAAISLKLDSGTPFHSGVAADPDAKWNGDGELRACLSSLRYGPETKTVAGTASVWKGPEDSIEYLLRYGIRYSARDACFLGLGMRNVSRDALSWPAVGFDGAAMEKGGHRMAPLGDANASALGFTWLATHAVATDSFIEIDHQGWNGVNGGAAYHSPNDVCRSLYDGSQYTNPNSFRGYHLVLCATASASLRGLRLKLGAFADVAGSYQFEVLDAPASFPTFSGEAHFLVGMRWLQTDVVFDEFSIYGEAIDYLQDDAIGRHRRLVLASGYSETIGDPDDVYRLATWSLDDGVGGRVLEQISGRDGALVPYSEVAWTGGAQGRERLFLSGEGDALVLDLSEDPVFQSEFLRMAESNEGGVALQVTLTIPEAHYAGLDSTGTEIVGLFAPTLLTWETREGGAAPPQPLFRLSHRGRAPLADVAAYWKPQGFTFEVLSTADQQPGELETVVSSTLANEWDETARWVGQSITLQVGLHATGNPDEFLVYLALSPKELVRPGVGEPGGLEVAYHATMVLPRRELIRSVVTIGGQFHPRGAAWSELGCRMWVDEVHVLAAPAPGVLAASGSANLLRDGKLVGGRALPTVGGDRDRLLYELGPGLRAVSVERGSRIVRTPSRSAFWPGDASETIDGLAGTFLSVLGDEVEVRQTQSTPTRHTDLYQIASATATEITLRSPYRGPSRAGAAAAQVRHVGYTNFEGLAQTDFALAIGSGPAYGAGATEEDAVLTGALVPNLAPFDGVWRLRLYRVAEDVEAVRCRWVRGVRVPTENQITGAAARGSQVFAGAGSALYRVDGRWRQVWRGQERGYALGFYGSKDWPHAPLDGDVALVAASLPVVAAAGLVWRVECEVHLDGIDGIRTVAWHGDPQVHPSLVGCTSWWMRIVDGRPELAVGSSETYDGTNQPEGGLYVARARALVRSGTRSMIRWEIPFTDLHAQYARCWVDGAEVGCSFGARGNGLTGSNWLTRASLEDAGTTLALGAARDWPVRNCEQRVVQAGVLSGQLLCPVRRSGWLHSLRGALAGFVVDEDASGSSGGVARLPEVGSASSSYTAHIPMSAGRGAVLEASGFSEPVVFYANPFIGLTYGHGDYDRPWTMATWGNRVFATAGGRPLVYDSARELLRPIGMLRPATAPTFEVTRRPLWVRNVQDGTSKSDPLPVVLDGSVQDVDAADPLNHYSSFGNAYLEQPTDEPMRWERVDSAPAGQQNDILAVKGLFMLRSINGRNTLFESRNSTDNGAWFIEVRDGRLCFGWYDTALKLEALIETDAPVVEPGTWYYLFLKKLYPQPSLNGWDNSLWSSGTLVHRDSLVLRRFVAGHNPPPNDGAWDVKPTTGAVDWPANVRHAISFTTLSAVDVHPDFTARGRVTEDSLTIDVTPTVGLAATFAVGSSSYANPFHGDMHGMLIQWHDGALARLGRITRCLPAGPTFELVVVDGLGPPTSVSDVRAAVCFGVQLVANTAAQSGNSPDRSLYPIRALGSALASSLFSGLQPVSGEMGSFGWVSIRENATTPGAPGSNPQIFHTSASNPMEIGTDTFSGGLTGPANDPPGQLLFAGGGVNHTVVQSSQPNEALEVQLDGVSAIGAASLRWRLLQPVELLDGVRQFSVTFYDPATDAETGPSPTLTVRPSADDVANGSAQSAVLLKGLPISPDGPWVQRRIYATLVDGVIPQLVATVPDNVTTEFEIDLSDADIAAGQPQRQFQRAPVRCNIVAVATQRLVLAAVAGNEDLLWYSEAYMPDRIPIENFAVFASGPGKEITGVAEYAGRAIVFKRNRYIASVLFADGAATQRQISDARGCVSHNSLAMVEESLVWLDPSGICAMSQGSPPRLISPPLRDVFRNEVDHYQLRNACAAVNTTRRQYVLAIRTDGELRISAEMRRTMTEVGVESTGWRFGMHRDVQVTALANVDDESAGIERLVAFDRYGFAWDIDVPRTAAMDLAGVLEAGDPPIDASAASLVRGLPIRVGENIVRAVAADEDEILLRTNGDAISTVTGVATIGVPLLVWASRWVDFDVPSRSKYIKRIDVHFGEDASGQEVERRVRISVYRNRPEPSLVGRWTVTTARKAALPCNIACAEHVQVVIDLPAPAADITLHDFHFEVTKIVFLVEDHDAS